MTILKDKCFSLRFCQTLCVQSGSPDLALHTLILTIRVWLLRPNAQFPSPFNSIPHLLLIILFSTPQLFFCNLPQFFLPSFVFFMAPTVESQQPPLEAENITTTTRVENEVSPIKSKVTVVGSGNWGSVAAKLIASNTRKLSSFNGLHLFFITAVV